MLYIPPLGRDRQFLKNSRKKGKLAKKFVSPGYGGGLAYHRRSNILLGAVYIVRAQHRGEGGFQPCTPKHTRGEGGSRPCTHVHMEENKRGKNSDYVIENFPLPREFSYCKQCCK